jgi:hypothetical protein
MDPKDNVLRGIFGNEQHNTASFFHSANTTTPFFSAGSALLQQQPQLASVPQGGNSSALDQIDNFESTWNIYSNAHEQLKGQVQFLKQSFQELRQAYTAVCQERDQMRAQVAAAEGRLAEVHRVVRRYAVVVDPVVASDGYTYERTVIQQYLDDCGREGQAAVSQQTKEELQNHLVPNQSLKKLVELLKNIKPSAEFQASGGAGGAKEDGAGVKAAAAGSAATGGVSICGVCTLTLPADQLEAHCKERGHLENVWKQQNQQDSQRGGKRPEGDGLEKRHPCVRIYGFCNYNDSCMYAPYPFEACLNYLKGKCRFGASCKELHVELNGAGRGAMMGSRGMGPRPGGRGRGRPE